MVAGSDRRFMVFDVSDKRARNSAYFRAMQAQLDNGGYGRMLHDLLEFELGDWHPRDTAGVSDDKDLEKQQSAGPEVHWLAGYLNSGVLDCQVYGRGGSVVHASDLYLGARKANRRLIDWSDHKFAAFLKDWRCTQIRSNGSLWRFPPLADMRNSFGPSILIGPPLMTRSTLGTTLRPRNPISGSCVFGVSKLSARGPYAMGFGQFGRTDSHFFLL